MKRILITGIHGFTGSYLLPHLAKKETASAEIIGIDLEPAPVNGVSYHRCDLSDTVQVREVISKTAPHEIYHLAGAFSNNFEIDYSANVLSTKNLLDALLESRLSDTRILLVGSSAEYGLVPSGAESISEETPLNPISIYGLTKVYQTYLVQTYVRFKNIDAVIARPFNAIGEGITDRLFVGRLIEQIKQYRRGETDKIVLGGVNGYRDYVDIRDLVSAYTVIMERGERGKIYNIGSGTLIRMEALLALFLSKYQISPAIVQTADPERKSDQVSLRADTKALKALGWRATIDIKRSVELFQ